MRPMNRAGFGCPSPPSVASASDFQPSGVLSAPLPPFSTASVVLSPRVMDKKVKPSFSVLPSVGPGRNRPPPPPPADWTVVFQLQLLLAASFAAAALTSS